MNSRAHWLTKSAFLALTAVSWLPSAWAQDTITLGTPSYGGDGCPAGTVSSTVGPDGQSLSILFDQFVVEAGGNTGLNQQRKSCNVAIPVHVPNGYAVSILSIDYRGFVNVPSGGLSRFNVEYFFAGRQGPAYSRNFTGPMNENFTLNNQLEATTSVWSECGQDVILRTNASMLAQTNSWREQASASVDSIDVGAGVVYHIAYRSCGATGPIPPAPIPPTQPLPPGPVPPVSQDRGIQGWVDSVQLVDRNQTEIRGWACARTYSAPVQVHVYAGGPAGAGEYVTSAVANLQSEPAISQHCGDYGVPHRYSIRLSASDTQRHAGKLVYVHGISPFGLSNSLLSGSGAQAVPRPMVPNYPTYPNYPGNPGPQLGQCEGQNYVVRARDRRVVEIEWGSPRCGAFGGPSGTSRCEGRNWVYRYPDGRLGPVEYNSASCR